MSGQIVQFALSLLAVVGIIACSHWLGFSRGGTIESEDEARELLRLTNGGFEPTRIAVDTEGKGAIGTDAGGRLAVLVPHGNRFVPRIVDDMSRLVASDRELLVTLPSPDDTALRLRIGAGALDWARRSQLAE